MCPDCPLGDSPFARLDGMPSLRYLVLDCDRAAAPAGGAAGCGIVGLALPPRCRQQLLPRPKRLRQAPVPCVRDGNSAAATRGHRVANKPTAAPSVATKTPVTAAPSGQPTSQHHWARDHVTAHIAAKGKRQLMAQWSSLAFNKTFDITKAVSQMATLGYFGWKDDPSGARIALWTMK
eukprot:gene1119-3038_t